MYKYLQYVKNDECHNILGMDEKLQAILTYFMFNGIITKRCGYCIRASKLCLNDNLNH